MAFDLKAATPDTTFDAANAFLFGADSQAATDPSIYQASTVFNALRALANTWTADQTISGGSLILSGNRSAPAWTTNGIRLRGTSGTLTDTSSTGVVAAAYTNVLGGNTIAASSSATYTIYSSLHLNGPIAGSNVTITNPYALSTGAGVRLGGDLTLDGGGGGPVRVSNRASNFLTVYLGATAFYEFQTSIGFCLHPNLKLGWGATSASSSHDTYFVRDSLGVVGSPGSLRIMNATAIPAGGTAGAGYKFSSTANFGLFFGSGAPSLAAAKGSLYLRSDGSGTGDRAYLNTDGSTGWTALTTAA